MSEQPAWEPEDRDGELPDGMDDELDDELDEDLDELDGGGAGSKGASAPRPHIEAILEPFFGAVIAGRSGIARQRVQTVLSHLRACMETDGHRILVTRDLVLLEAEKQFAPGNAFARTMHADDLVYVLAMFVDRPWLHELPPIRRVQLDVVALLADQLQDRGLIDAEDLICTLLDIKARIRSARRELREA